MEDEDGSKPIGQEHCFAPHFKIVFVNYTNKIWHSQSHCFAKQAPAIIPMFTDGDHSSTTVGNSTFTSPAKLPLNTFQFITITRGDPFILYVPCPGHQRLNNNWTRATYHRAQTKRNVWSPLDLNSNHSTQMGLDFDEWIHDKSRTTISLVDMVHSLTDWLPLCLASIYSSPVVVVTINRPNCLLIKFGSLTPEPLRAFTANQKPSPSFIST